MKAIALVVVVALCPLLAAGRQDAPNHDKGQDPAKGTLTVSVKPPVVSVKLSKDEASRIQLLTMTWGVDTFRFLVTEVNQKLLKPKHWEDTRPGESDSAEIEPGEYTVNCAGFRLAGSSGDLNEILKKDAFFNLDVIRFSVRAKGTTVLEVTPEMAEKLSTGILTRTTSLQPQYEVRIAEDGVEKGQAAICRRDANAIAWGAYSGDLKLNKLP